MAEGMFNRRSFVARTGSSLAALFAGATFPALRVIAAETGSLLASVKRYLPGDPAFLARRDSLTWQAIKPQRTPRAIYEVRSESDAVEVIRHARQNRLRVSVVSGGHSFIGNGIQDNALLLDLSSLKQLEVDASARRAKLQPGVRVLEFDSALEPHGLAFPVGHSATVGLGGYLLGGGHGWNGESWNNVACFNVTAVEAVTAAGERVTADRVNHPDLFWAARGAGPNFPAVVTKFHVNVFQRPAAIRESAYVYPLSALPEVAAWLERVQANQSRELELSLIFVSAPAAESGKPPARQCIVSAIYYADSDADARAMHHKVIQHQPKIAPVFTTELVPRTIRDLLLTDKASAPVRHCMESLWTDDPTQAALLVGKRFADVPSSASLALLNYRADPSLPEDAAYSRIDKAYLFVDGTWDKSIDDAANRNWVDAVMTDLAPLDRGSYINESEFDRHPARATHAFSPANLERVKQIIRRYDSQGMFVSPLNP